MSQIITVGPKDVAAKRRAMKRDFFRRMFALGGLPGATDTYKRTMWAAVPDIAVLPATYHLTMRKGLQEPGADNQLIMAGHEAMLAQWFFRALKRKDIELARYFFGQQADVKAFPDEVWDKLLAEQPGDNIFLNMDVWGFPGGQTFLAGLPGQPSPPSLVFEAGMGGLISYVEPAMCRYFAPVIQATKAMLMKEASPRSAEFGLRAAPNEISHMVLLLAMVVGAGKPVLTSNDQAKFMWPELFRDIGTVGHEMMCAAQELDKSLSDAEYEMMTRAVLGIENAKLLCDLVDAETVGRLNLIRVLSENPERKGAGSRVDSGKIADQCAQQHLDFKNNGRIGPRVIVFEDEVQPHLVREVYAKFKEVTGEEPTVLFPGAGGYFWRLVHRDSVSAAFKRSETNGNPNMKFSNSPGKESLPGTPRVYGQDDVMYVADVRESVDGEPLYVQLVKQGKIVYNEPFLLQHERAKRTWRKYRRVELSPSIRQWKEAYEAKRAREIELAKAALSAA